MAKLGFRDARKNLIAYVEGEASIGTIWRSGVPTMALRVNGEIVARAEEIDGLRWAVEMAKVTVVDQSLLERNTLGDNGRSFGASVIQAIDN